MDARGSRVQRGYMQKLDIHKTAIIDERAQLAEGVSVGPYSIIGPDVVIGAGTQIGSHCVITGRTTIGANGKIFTGAVIGSVPQDLKHLPDDVVYLEIGDNNIIREYVTMNPGTLKGGGKTLVGSHNLFMAYTHIAHDCVVGNHCIMANGASLAGHVTLEDNVVMGGFSGVHQFCRVGRLAMIGGMAKIVQDVPPFSMVDGNPAAVKYINAVGLERAKVPAPSIQALKKAFKLLFLSKLSRQTAMDLVSKEVEHCPELEHLIFFIKTSKRGLI